MKRRSIDDQRDGAITLRIGCDGDLSKLKEFITTVDNLYVLKENGLFKVYLADDFDPDRTNPNIPNASQQVLSEGSGNEIVARILLTSKFLFDEKRSPVDPFVGRMLEQSIDLARHVLELNDMTLELKKRIQEKENAFRKKEHAANSFSLPAVPSLATDLHNIFIKADKVKDSILSLYWAQLFPEKKKRPQMQEYGQAIASISGASVDLSCAWDGIKEFLGLIRNIRNSSEHPKKGQQVILQDFFMNTNGDVVSPLAEIEHNQTPIKECPVVELLDYINKHMLDCAEASIVFVKCASLEMGDNPFSEFVTDLPIEKRRHPMVRYYRAVNLRGAAHILG